MKYKKLIEWLANKEHEQWSHWTEYLLNNLNEDNMQRLKKQIKKPYNELTTDEKK